mgnify:CR=1 FL=1
MLFGIKWNLYGNIFCILFHDLYVEIYLSCSFLGRASIMPISLSCELSLKWDPLGTLIRECKLAPHLMTGEWLYESANAS